MAIFSHRPPPRKTTPPGHSDQEPAILPASAIAEKRTGKGRNAVRCWHSHAGNSCSLSCRHDLANRLESREAALRSAPPASAHFQDGGGERHGFLAYIGAAHMVFSHFEPPPTSRPAACYVEPPHLPREPTGSARDGSRRAETVSGLGSRRPGARGSSPRGCPKSRKN